MTRLVDEWPKAVASEDEASAWKPRLFDPADAADWDTLRELVRSGRVRALHDTIDEQLAELAETRHPRSADAAARPRHVAELLAGRTKDRYGRWAYYPWSGRVVHLLPEPEYRELRTSRNRYKITADEQQRLASLRLGIVGLSVGQATAVTLALEEVGGEFRLADFDRLSLSNMNRLRAGVHSIGLNKAVLTAREIFEINPYARVRLFTDGLSDANVDEFLDGGGRLDLLFEECDDLYMKVFVRERARALGIPTLMETSDRGLIDVERFDLEPRRPLLHGLIGDTRAEELRGLSTADKVPFVLDILGTNTLSPRFAGTLYEIDRTVRTWPQLASGVALGGALNTDAARRIALGSFQGSGRFYVDLETLVGEGHGVDVSRAPPLPRVETPAPAPAVLGTKRRLDEGTVRELVRMATLAPSGGNVQPWLFELDRHRLLLRYDPQRSGSLLDFERRGTFLALGAAAENLRIAAAAAGLRVDFREFPDTADASLACELTFGPGADTPASGELRAIAERVTNRRHAAPQPLSSAQLDAMRAAADRSGATLQFLTDRGALDELGSVLGAGDWLRFVNDELRGEMAWEVRWTEEEVLRTRDGLDVRSLELNATDRAAMRLALSGAGLDLVRTLDLGSALHEGAHKAMARCSAALLVSVDGHGARTHFAGGRAVEAVWAAANAAGVAVQPYTALVYIMMRHGLGDASAFTPRQRELLTDLQRRFRRLFPLPSNRTEMMLLRLAHAAPPSARALRRPVEDVLTIRR